MMQRETLSAWWAQQIAPRPECAIIQVNYMDIETPGGELFATEQGDFVVFNGRPTVRNCTIASCNFSAHMSGRDGERLEDALCPKKILHHHYGSYATVRDYATSHGDTLSRFVMENGKEYTL
jgi:hypothetical protein